MARLAPGPQSGVRTASACDLAPKIAPSAATTGRQHPFGVFATPHIIRFIGIRSSPARSLVPHPRLTAAAVSLWWIRA